MRSVRKVLSEKVAPGVAAISARIAASARSWACAQQVGRAEAGYDLGGTHESEIHIDLAPDLDGQASGARSMWISLSCVPPRS
jgi:hypothetical protein